MQDIYNRINSVSSLAPIAKTATASGTGVDLTGFDSAVAIVHFGAWTDGSFTPSLEESDASGSGYAAVAAGDMQGSFTAVTSATGQNATQKVGYVGKKRYIRVTFTVSGSPSTGAVVAATILRGNATKQPA